MRIATLIALVAKRVLDAEPERIGVRMSPVTLTAAQVVEALKAAREALGSKAFLVGSAPGVAAVALGDRAYTAPDHRAAERATAWRNSVNVGAGEHLVYVSVEEHAKASGLKDCLVPIREGDLLDAFVAWCEGAKSGMPPGFAEAIQQAELTKQVRVAALCDLATAVVKDAPRGGAMAWESVGRNLPMIGLARDSRLGKMDAADRLASNAQMVRAADTGESRRRSSSGPLATAEGELYEALAGTSKEERRKALAAVDLGALKTTALGKKPQKAKAPRPAAPPAAKPADTKRGKGAAAEKPVTKSGAASQQHPAEAPPAPPPGGPPKISESPEPSKHGVRAVRLQGPALAKGVASLLTCLLEGDGDPVEVITRVEPRALLRDLPKPLIAEVRVAARARARLARPFAAWSSTRRKLIGVALAGREGQRACDLFTRGLSALLGEADFAAVFARFVEAATALYEAAQRSDELTMREVLDLDTCAVAEKDALATLRLIGPLHLLAIGQAMTARRTADAAKSLTDHAHRLVLRALEAAPAAPNAFAAGSGELTLGRVEGGLLVYERVPEVAPKGALVASATALLQRYLALSPHALLGCRIALLGDGDLAPLVEGLAAVCEADPTLAVLEVLCAHPPDLDEKGGAVKAIQRGALRLGSIAEDGVRAAHIVIRVAGLPSRPEDEEATAPAVKTFAPSDIDARTTFDLRPRGLRVRTSIAGSPELEAVEALVARSRGQLPQRAFIADVAGLSLRAEVQRTPVGEAAWVAVIAPTVGRRPPLNWYLLAHEEVSPGATCAVVTRDIKPATRALQEGLHSLNLRNVKPRTLQMLALRLAEMGRSAIVALTRPAEHLVAVGLLAVEMRRVLGVDSHALIAPVTGAIYEALLGEPESKDTGSLFLGVARGAAGLSFLVGYATLDAHAEIDLSKPQLAGALARSIGQVADAVRLAATGDGLGAAAAREVLAWALWSALAADDDSQNDLRDALASWRAPLSATIEALLLLPPSIVGNKEKIIKLGRARAIVRPLSMEQLNVLLLG